MLPQAATKSLASPLAGELASRLSAMPEEGEGQVADAPLPQPGMSGAYKKTTAQGGRSFCFGQISTISASSSVATPWALRISCAAAASLTRNTT